MSVWVIDGVLQTVDTSDFVRKSTVTTKGDIYGATASATVTRLGVGSDDQVLTADSGETTGLKWATPSAASGSSMSFAVVQASHGLSVGDVVRHNGTIYVTAKADTEANAEVIGIVSAVADTGNFTLLVGGQITGLTGLTAGDDHYLSAATAGALTATEPSTSGQVSKPLVLAYSTTAGVFNNMRGQVIA